MAGLKYRRVLLKISGEGLCGTGGFGLDAAALAELAEQLANIADMGAQLAIVVGGGNFIRGHTLTGQMGVHRATADHMGMLATVINALALRDTLIGQSVPAVVMSAFAVGNVCETFQRQAAIEHLEAGRVVIFAAGTGNPFVTTDTCASLRAAEIDAEVIIKATKVDGVFSADPMRDSSARLYETLTFDQVLRDDLKVMDHAAVAMCRDHGIDIVVCNLMKPPAVAQAIEGAPVGTRVSGGGN